MMNSLVKKLAAPRESFSANALVGLAPESFCRELLPHVSRTFAISVPCLPAPMDLHVTVAYLICRLADTIEDGTQWTGPERQQAFQNLGVIFEAENMIESAATFELHHGKLPGEQACEMLFRRARAIFEVLAGFPEPVIAATRKCVCEMIDGMSATPAAHEGWAVRRLFDNLDQMERYCHYVAGVVGTMLTEMLDWYLAGKIKFATPERLEQGHRFGLGLQMTNILVDQVDDARAGKSYIPALTGMPQSERVPALIARASEHLDEAMYYTLALPIEPTGLRMFCLLPLLFALRTLGLVRDKHAGVLAAERPRISGEDVLEIAGHAALSVADDSALRDWYERLREPLLLPYSKSY